MAGVLTRPLPRESKQKPSIRPFPLLANRDPSFPTRRALHVTVLLPYSVSSSPDPPSSLLHSAPVSDLTLTCRPRASESLHNDIATHICIHATVRRLQDKIPNSILVCAHTRVVAYQSRAAPSKPSSPTRPNEPPFAPAPFLVGTLTGVTPVVDDCVPAPDIAGLGTPAGRTAVGFPVA